MFLLHVIGRNSILLKLRSIGWQADTTLHPLFGNLLQQSQSTARGGGRCPQYNRSMTLSGPFLPSVNRLLPVPAKSQSDETAPGSCSDFGLVYNLANNRTMHPQQHATCASVSIAVLPQLRRRTLCFSASPKTSLSSAAGSNSAIPLAPCNPLVKAERPA